MTNPHIIITITGPSGSGKTVLSNLLQKEGMKSLVSTTTRAPRLGEINGVDYYFLSKEQFEEDLKLGKFMEDVEYNGTLYGVSECEAKKVFSMGKTAILVAEPHGVSQIKHFCEERGWQIMRIFVDNPENKLLGRLLNRVVMDTTGFAYPDEELEVYESFVKRIIKSLNNNDDNLNQVLTEMINDFATKNNKPIAKDYNEKILAASHRLKSFKFEQDNWVKPARTGVSEYELLIPEFNKFVEDSVVGKIKESLNNLKSVKKISLK